MRASAIYIEDASRRVMAAAALVRVLRQGSQEDWERAVGPLAGMSACERAVAWVQFMDRAAKDGSLASAMVQYEQCRFVFDMVLKDVVDERRRIRSDAHAVADTSAADTTNSSRASSINNGLYYASDDNDGLDFAPSPYVRPPIPRPRPQSAPAHANQGGPPTIPRGENESMADYARRVSQMHVPRIDMVEPPHVPRVPIPQPPRPRPPPQDNRPQSARVRDNMDIVEEDAEDRELPVHQGWRPVPWRGHGV